MNPPTYDGLVSAYNRGDRSLAARRAASLRVRAAFECSCTVCGGPCWGKYVDGRFRVAQRCIECVKRERKQRSVQPRGLTYQWGCP